MSDRKCPECGSDDLEYQCWRCRKVKELQERESKLLEVIKMQKEALELYSKKTSWTLSGSIRNSRTLGLFCQWGETLSDFEEFIERNTMGYPQDGPFYYMKVPGKRARETLAKVEETLKEIGVEL